MAGRLIRLDEVTRDSFVELQERYADLLRAYIDLGNLHVELMVRYHHLLDANLKGSKVNV